jgi:hypothetical protein
MAAHCKPNVAEKNKKPKIQRLTITPLKTPPAILSATPVAA